MSGGKPAARNRPAKRTVEEINQPSRNRRQWVVVTYDIPDDRRRLKVMKLLAGYGRWAQLSVFECEVRPADLTIMVERLNKLIRKESDDVRIYPLCETCVGKTVMLGTARLHRHVSFAIV